MMMDDDDKVGYGRPPKHSRFVKGQSGNPKGRPKEVKSLRTEIRKVLRERITIHEGTRSKKVTKLYALLQSLFLKPFKGDSGTSIKLLDSLVRLVDPNSDLNPEPLNFNYGPTGKKKELTPSEKMDYLRKMADALNQAKGLRPRADRTMLGDEAEVLGTTDPDKDNSATANRLPRPES